LINIERLKLYIETHEEEEEYDVCDVTTAIIKTDPFPEIIPDFHNQSEIDIINLESVSNILDGEWQGFDSDAETLSDSDMEYDNQDIITDTAIINNDNIIYSESSSASESESESESDDEPEIWIHPVKITRNNINEQLDRHNINCPKKAIFNDKLSAYECAYKERSK
jgi:U3 small nucleolar RNA-associated protein 14